MCKHFCNSLSSLDNFSGNIVKPIDCVVIKRALRSKCGYQTNVIFGILILLSDFMVYICSTVW